MNARCVNRPSPCGLAAHFSWPALDGPVATSRKYALGVFSDATFSSDETQRYLAEYGKDVAQAQQQVSQLQPSAPGP